MKTNIYLILIKLSILTSSILPSNLIEHKFLPNNTGIELDDCISEISYNSHIKFILDKTCAIDACHVSGSSMKGDFSSYSGVSDFIGSSGNIAKRIIESRDMPPVYSPGPNKLTDEEINMISCWIRQGYKE